MLTASRTALGVSRQFLLRGTPSPILNNRIRLQTGCYIIDYVQAQIGCLIVHIQFGIQLDQIHRLDQIGE